jgi:hypothetical protein
MREHRAGRLWHREMVPVRLRVAVRSAGHVVVSAGGMPADDLRHLLAPQHVDIPAGSLEPIPAGCAWRVHRGWPCVSDARLDLRRGRLWLRRAHNHGPGRNRGRRLLLLRGDGRHVRRVLLTVPSHPLVVVIPLLVLLLVLVQ